MTLILLSLEYYFRWRKFSHHEPSHTLSPASYSTPAETLQQRQSSVVSCWRADYIQGQSRRSSTIIYPPASSHCHRKPSLPPPRRLSLCQVSDHLRTNKRRESCLPNIERGANTIDEGLEDALSIEKREGIPNINEQKCL